MGQSLVNEWSTNHWREKRRRQSVDLWRDVRALRLVGEREVWKLGGGW